MSDISIGSQQPDSSLDDDTIQVVNFGITLDQLQTALSSASTASDTATTQASIATTKADEASASASSASDDADSTAADVTLTHADAAQTAEDRVATGEDRTQTGLDRMQTGQDRTDAIDAKEAAVVAQGLAEDARDEAVTAQGLSESARDASVAAKTAAEASANDASASASSASTDASSTASDVLLTHADVVLTHADVVSTNADAASTAADAIATAEDRVQTGLDASSASTSAGQALTYAQDAGTYATSAYNSKVDVETAKTAAEAALDSFTDVYLGSKEVEPTLDNDNNPLQLGALYFNSVAGEMRVYDGSTWVTAYVNISGVVTETGVAALTNKTLNSYTNQIHADALHYRVKGVGAGIVKGSPLKFVGYNAGEEAIEVSLANSATDVSIGLAEDAISNGSFGTVVSSGLLTGVDTSTYSEGAILYVDGTGVLTATEPTTGYSQPIAFVLRSHANNGAIQVLAAYPKQDASDVRYDSFTTVADRIANTISHIDLKNNPHSVTASQIGAEPANANIQSHIASTSNPHSITASQVGLGNVDNTADIDKPVSTAQQTALDLKADNTALSNHTGNTSNPHAVTASQVGAEPANSNIQSHITSESNPHNVTASQVEAYTTTQVDTALAKQNISLYASQLLAGDFYVANLEEKPTQVAVTYTGQNSGTLSTWQNDDGSITADGTNIGDYKTESGPVTSVVTNMSTIDFTQSSNGTGYYLDRTTNQVKSDAGTVQDGGSIDFSGISGIDGVSKVHIKDLDAVTSHMVFNGLQGAGISLSYNLTNAEIPDLNKLNSFTTSGFILASDPQVNASGRNYIAYQTLYTNIKWGTTNHGKLYVVAYNPHSLDTMVYYEGSGTAGHEIPHGLGRELGFATVKNLTDADAGLVFFGDTTKTLSLFGTTSISSDTNGEAAARSSTTTFTANSEESLTLGTEARANELSKEFVLYGFANAYYDNDGKLIGNKECGTYIGTSASGNKVTTLGKPAEVTVKCITDTGDWIKDSNKQTGNDTNIFANVIEINSATAAYVTKFHTRESDGFTLTSADVDGINPEINAANEQYLYIVSYDTKLNGGGAYQYLPSETSNLQADNVLANVTNGADTNGIISKTKALSGTLSPTLTEGENYIWVDEDGTVGASPYKPSFDPSEYNGFGDVFNPRDGKWYSDVAVILLNDDESIDFSQGTVIPEGRSYIAKVTADASGNVERVEQLPRQIFAEEVRADKVVTPLIEGTKQVVTAYYSASGDSYNIAAVTSTDVYFEEPMDSATYFVSDSNVSAKTVNGFTTTAVVDFVVTGGK